MTTRITLLSIFVFALMFGCSKDTSPTGPDNNDPNGEEELLKAFKADEGAGVVKVMTRNVYIGANVDVVLEAQTEQEVALLVTGAYQQLMTTDFTSRAAALASEIERSNPHLVGLQEMTKFYIQDPGDLALGGQVPATDKFLDFFEELMAALDARGLHYVYAGTKKNADVELPMITGIDNEGNPTFADIRIEDHDAILARDDILTGSVLTTSYDSFLVVPEFGISIPRGFVAVSAEIGDIDLTFVNTHLEAFSTDDGVRLYQAEQLMDAFYPERGNVVIAGDFNSQAPTGQTYQYILSQGYTDVWTENTLTYNPNGYTYGHDDNLRNDEPGMFERIDFLFVGTASDATIGEGFVLGDEKRDKTASGLWPSDHAGVVAKLTFPLTMKIAADK